MLQQGGRGGRREKLSGVQGYTQGWLRWGRAGVSIPGDPASKKESQEGAALPAGARGVRT